MYIILYTYILGLKDGEALPLHHPTWRTKGPELASIWPRRLAT